jgi:ribosomal protein L29
MAKTQKKLRENVKGMKDEDLKKNLAVLEESARVIRFKREGAKSKNVKELVGLRKQIARILTETNSRKVKN